MKFPIFIVLVFFSLFVRTVLAEVDDGTVIHSGEATFYGDGALGHCGFPVDRQPLYHGAMNHTDYDTAAACGTWVSITGPKGEVTAYIDDECPECKEGDIDLGPGTFTMVADRALGRVPITWHYVPSPDTTPIVYYWKEGSSQWHIELQIRNHRYGIQRVEIKNRTSEWIEMPRMVYNYFKLPGGIDGEEGPYSIRTTDVFSQQVADTGLFLTEATESTGTANFPRMQSTVQKNKLRRVNRRNSKNHMTLVVSGMSQRSTPVISEGMEIYTLEGKRIKGSARLFSKKTTAVFVVMEDAPAR